MRHHRLLRLALLGLALLMGAGCYARIYGPPLLIPVPVPMGGWGYHRSYYEQPAYGHGYGRY